MREIKFEVLYKGKHFGYEQLNHYGKWEWSVTELNPDNMIRWCHGVMNDNTDLIRRQFTGLLDKNGKEIYEGDILNCSRNGFMSGNFTNIPSEVKWSKHPYSAWEAHPIRNEEQEKDEEYGVYSHYTFGLQVYSSDCEIIGNIYSNPELINK